MLLTERMLYVGCEKRSFLKSAMKSIKLFYHTARTGCGAAFQRHRAPVAVCYGQNADQPAQDEARMGKMLTFQHVVGRAVLRKAAPQPARALNITFPHSPKTSSDSQYTTSSKSLPKIQNPAKAHTPLFDSSPGTGKISPDGG